jgi:hypothetical protein
MNNISSMWGKIFDCHWPVDRIAALVAFAKGWDSTTQKQIEVSEYGKYTNPPPEGICDYRGRRSVYNVIIGFSNRVQRRVNNSPSRAKWKIDNGLAANAQISYQNKSIWFVLRADGKVSRVNGLKLRNKLEKMDKRYLALIDDGEILKTESSEWLAISGIPTSKTPCNHKRYN